MRKIFPKLKQHKAKTTKGQISVNQSSCDGCCVCTTICTKKVFQIKELTNEEILHLSLKGRIKVKIKGRRKSYAKNIEACIKCGICINSCHERAIRFV